MNDPETRLTAALRADAPPARDASFRIDVLVRLERARFRRRVALTVPVAIVAAVLAAVSAPTLDAWMGADIQRAWIVALGAVATLSGLSAVLVGAPTTVGTVTRAFRRWLFP